ncbi:hypothetical protein [Kordia sp.]|uniref:hypothetical protein n=1 Tax=Kordia sp. TaxID=1965332 RepID=UPI003B58FAE1
MKKNKSFKINKFKVARLNNLHGINGGSRKTKDKGKCPLDTTPQKTKDVRLVLCKSDNQANGGVC